MMFRRKSPQPELSPFAANAVGETATQLVELAGRYLDMLDAPDSAERAAEAREHARMLALLSRGLFILATEIGEDIPEPLDPQIAVLALRRLEFAFIALAQHPTDTPT